MAKKFKTICRPRILPAAAKIVLGDIKLEGENRLEIKNENGDHHLYFSGSVGKSWWDDSGITEQEARDALNAIPKGSKIHAHINSEGGSVQEGLGIYNAFKERSSELTAHIDGYALSIASVFPLAASKVISPTAAIWMIHNASSGAYGDSEEMQKAANMLKEHNEMLAEVYSEHTGKPKSEILDDMAAETWIRGSQAVEYGLADECDEDDCSNKLSRIPKAWLDRCKNIPANIYNSLALPISAAPQGAAQQKQNKNADNIMKAKLIALLNGKGIKNAAGQIWSDTDTEEAVFAAAEKAMATQPAPTNVIDLTAVQAQLDAIKKNRIQDMVEGYVADNKITKDEVLIYVEAALKDEAKVKSILDAKAATPIGGMAAGTYFEVGGAPTHKILQGKVSEAMVNCVKDAGDDKRKAYNALKENMGTLRQDAFRKDAVQNANTISSSLTTNFLILGATTQASPKFASVKMFSRDTSVDPYKPLATGQMKYNTTAQDGSTTLTNATNFEQGDSTVTNVAVTVSQYTEPFHLTNSDLNSGIRMEDLVVAKMASMGSKVSKVLAANITAANYSTLTAVIRSAGAFSFSDMNVLWGQLKKANRKNVMLDGPYLAKLINIPTLFQPTPVVPGAGWKDLLGWDYVALHTEWSAAGNNIIGFACDPQALGVIAGLPLIDSAGIPGGILAQAQGMCVGVDLAISAYAWFNPSTRIYWASYDLMFGAAPLDTTIGNVIASGTPS